MDMCIPREGIESPSLKTLKKLVDLALGINFNGNGGIWLKAKLHFGGLFQI